MPLEAPVMRKTGSGIWACLSALEGCERMVFPKELCEQRDGEVHLAAAWAPDQPFADECVLVGGEAALVACPEPLGALGGPGRYLRELGHRGEKSLLGL